MKPEVLGLSAAPKSRAGPGENNAWPRGEIDRFILAKLEEKRLTPAGDADKLTCCGA
jgi:hypothetical protein